MAGLLGARHRELHAREEAALAALDDVPFGPDVGLGPCHAERVEAELLAQPADLLTPHARIVPS